MRRDPPRVDSTAAAIRPYPWRVDLEFVPASKLAGADGHGYGADAEDGRINSLDARLEEILSRVAKEAALTLALGRPRLGLPQGSFLL